MTRVSTAEFIKNYGTLADKALQEPVTITKNGKDRLVLLSVDLHQRMKMGRMEMDPEALAEKNQLD